MVSTWDIKVADDRPHNDHETVDGMMTGVKKEVFQETNYSTNLSSRYEIWT
jgi:hypothetical protein